MMTANTIVIPKRPPVTMRLGEPLMDADAR
jgi:hypothetical protein